MDLFDWLSIIKQLKEQGLIHPILVRPLKNGLYEVVAGMRRYYAMKELGFEIIECHVRKLTDFEAILLAYIENIQRENLTPIETGRMYKSLIDKLPSNGTRNFQNLKIPESKKIEEIAKKMKVSKSSIRNYISLLELPKGIQNSIEANFQKRSMLLGRKKDEFIRERIHDITNHGSTPITSEALFKKLGLDYKNRDDYAMIMQIIHNDRDEFCNGVWTKMREKRNHKCEGIFS